MSATVMLHTGEHGAGPAVVRPGHASRESQPVLRFAPDESIYAQGDTAGSMYRLVSGVVRCCKFQPDGRRHINAFCKPGDVFGFELAGEHLLSAEAVTACAVVRMRCQGMEKDPAAAIQLYGHAMRSLARAQAHSQLLGRSSAGQRLAAFLLEMLPGTSEDVETLPMARHDIADYLGLTIETISRTMGQLEKEGLLELVTARRIRIRDRQGLAALCGCEEPLDV
ncbi:helix-turn-helix domain-containing protein [Acidocella sp.]|uniref:helix-turn-helix domain-containing protein n=1 Tax=Acidocella sp. TaxID=50710 RepID=UPI003D05A422